MDSNSIEDDIRKEMDVLKSELAHILTEEMPPAFKNIGEFIELAIRYISPSRSDPSLFPGSEHHQHHYTEMHKQPMGKIEKLTLMPTNGIEGLKCALTINSSELRNIEINYKPSIRHNNYIYKSRDESPWNLYQISNCANILRSIQTFLVDIRFDSIDQALFNVDHLMDSINAARNILLFPKKRQLSELQSQKNMKIFPLVPNDLVFSFYIQGHRLCLAIYVIKGNETTKHLLECSSVAWLNNVMSLMTTSLQKLQQVKDKLSNFDQLVELQSMRSN